MRTGIIILFRGLYCIRTALYPLSCIGLPLTEYKVEDGMINRRAKTKRKRRTGVDSASAVSIQIIRHIPVGQSRKAHGTLKCLDKCAASAFTPKTSVA